MQFTKKNVEGGMRKKKRNYKCSRRAKIYFLHDNQYLPIVYRKSFSLFNYLPGIRWKLRKFAFQFGLFACVFFLNIITRGVEKYIYTKYKKKISIYRACWCLKKSYFCKVLFYLKWEDWKHLNFKLFYLTIIHIPP